MSNWVFHVFAYPVTTYVGGLGHLKEIEIKIVCLFGELDYCLQSRIRNISGKNPFLPGLSNIYYRLAKNQKSM